MIIRLSSRFIESSEPVECSKYPDASELSV